MQNADGDSEPFSYAEDLKLCIALVHRGGIEARGTAAWFRVTFVPPPPELAHRSLDSLMRRYLALKDELLDALARTHRENREDVSWEWLTHKHTRALPQYAQDLALCQLVLSHHKLGLNLNAEWFNDVVAPAVGLDGQGALLLARYEAVLRGKLARSVLFSPTGRTGFRWLREMHGIAYEPEVSRADSLSAISALEGAPLHSWATQQAERSITHPTLVEGRQRRTRRPARLDDDSFEEKRARLVGADVQALLLNLDARAVAQVIDAIASTCNR